MKLSEIISKAVDAITERPVILVPCLVPFILSLIVSISGFFAAFGRGYWGQFAQVRWEAMSPEEAVDMWRAFVPGMATFAIANFVVSIIIWFTAVVAFSMVISMVAAYLEGKEMSLSEAFNSISGYLLILVIASAAITVLKYVGICTLCILTFIMWVFFALVKQGIILDKLGLGDSFSKSWNVAKNNFFDIFLILLLFFVIKIVLGIIPVAGDSLGYLVDAFSVAAVTIFYIDRRG